MNSQVDRRLFINLGVAAVSTAAITPAAFAGDVVTTSSGLQYEILSAGSGQKPVLGDLCAVRFQGQFKGVVFDDILNNPEPYYFRVGSNLLLKVSVVSHCRAI